MEMNEENSNSDLGNDLSKNLPSSEEIIRENPSVSKDEVPIHKIELIKTTYDRIVQSLDILSSIAMVVVTVYIAIFAYKQWNAAEKQVIAANKQVDAANIQIQVAKVQTDLVSKQTVAAEKQTALANEQIKIAKAQNKFMRRLNEEAKISNLNLNPVDVTYYSDRSNDGKDKVDMVFKNMSARPTAILSIVFTTKEGQIFRTISESDGIKLPLNIGAWAAEKISFGLRKGDREQLKDILVTDLDNKKIPAEQRMTVVVTGVTGIVIDTTGKMSSSQNVRVTKNQTVPAYSNKISIFVRSIESAHDSIGLEVSATFSAPGKESKIFSSIKIGDCLSYAGYEVRLKSVSPDAADFTVSDGEPCE